MPETQRPRAEGMHIRQSTTVHVITDILICLMLDCISSRAVNLRHFS